MAAFDPELAAFREALPEAHARAVGIGAIDAALGTARVIDELRPDLVIAIGTAGAFLAEDVGSVIIGSEVVLVDVAAVLGKTAVPDVVLSRVKLTDAFGARAALRVIANTLGVTTDDVAARAICDSTGAGVEHMEAFAIARACEMRGARCGVVLGISNVVGSSGRAEWLKNHVAASARAGRFVADEVRKLL